MKIEKDGVDVIVLTETCNDVVRDIIHKRIAMVEFGEYYSVNEGLDSFRR